MSPYTTAIERVSATLSRRGGYFRNLIAFVALLPLVAVGWSIVTVAPEPLAALVLLLPACGLFVCLDMSLVERLRSELLHLWVSGAIELVSLRRALEAIPTLPPGTVQGMLDRLPTDDNRHGAPPVSLATREAVARVSRTIDACQRQVVALRTISCTLVVGAVVAAPLLRTWWPLAGLLAVVPERLAHPLIAHLQLRRIERIIVAMRREGDLQMERFTELVGALSWELVLAARRDRFLARMRTSPVR